MCMWILEMDVRYSCMCAVESDCFCYFCIAVLAVKACSSPAFFFSFHRQRTSIIACLCCCHVCRHSHACSSGESRISASRVRVCVIFSGQSLFTHVFLSRLFQLAPPNPRPPFLSVGVMGNLSQLVFQLCKASLQSLQLE